MRPNSKFSNKSKSFWANVRSCSQKIGYTVRGLGQVKVPTIGEIKKAFLELNLDSDIIIQKNLPTKLGNNLIEYYKYRADILNNFVEPRLMEVDKAKAVFEQLLNNLNMVSIS